MAYRNASGQARFGVRSMAVTTGQVDADATSFIAAAGITDLTQASAINVLVNDLKTYGIWSKMKALYPFVGGTAAAHKYNLKDPRDLDAAYRLVFNGGWIHSSNGALPNGTNGYANTKLIPNVAFSNSFKDNLHISSYTMTNTPAGNKSNGVYMTNNRSDLAITEKGSASVFSGAIGSEVGSDYITVSNTDSRGYFILSRTSNSVFKAYKNSLLVSTNTNVTTNYLATLPYYIAAINSEYDSGAVWYNDKLIGFHTIGEGLSDLDSQNLYTSVQKFQTTLGRQVGTPYVGDADAVSFLNAAGITDLTQASAINTLVTDLKTANIWSKMKALYPFVGGSATSHKFNLKDPRDLDAAYRLQFNGGWTHNSNGVTPNGSNGFARTFFVDTNLSVNSVSYSIYNRSNTPQNAIYCDFGYFRNNSSYISNLFSTNYAPYGWGGRVNSWTPGNGGTRTDYRGFYNGNRTNSTEFNLFLNGTKALTQNDNTSGKLQTGYQFHLGCLFIDGQYYGDWSTNNYAFAHIGDGLTDAEAAALHRAVQKYQTTLGRQIDVPLVSDSDAQSFLNAAGITSYTQANAVNTLVVDLKAAGIWAKMKAVYPFVGGTATSHKFNLKDPRDVDAAYRLVFNGGWTHTSTGAKPNGTTGYANTYFSPNNNQTFTSGHFALYSRTNSISTQQWASSGVRNTDGVGAGMSIKRGFDNLTVGAMWNENTGGIVNAGLISDDRGFYNITRTSNNSLIFYKNNSIISTNTNTQVSTYLSTNYYYIGSINDGTGPVPNSYENREFGFTSIGDGLTDTESLAFYTAVQKFQTSLGRQVGTPVYNTNGLVLDLDAGNANSYPGTGTTWFDLASGNNGTLVNGPTYDSANGGSILFDGVNDSGSNSNIGILGNTPFTLCFYDNILSNPSGDGVMVLYGKQGTLYEVAGLYYRNSDNYVRFTTWGGIGQDYATGFLKDFNQWHYWTLVYNGTSVLVYRDGISDPNGSQNRSINITLGELRYGGTIAGYLNNKISNISLYNRALSATEVLQNFNNTRGRFGL